VPKFRRPEVRAAIEEHWDDVSAAMQDVLDFVRSHTFIKCDKALPSYNVLIPLIYPRYHYPKQFRTARGIDQYIVRASLARAFSGHHDRRRRGSQVDYGAGPMVRHPVSGKYRRTRLFVLTLGYWRKSVRLLVWHSSAQVWAELHERASRRTRRHDARRGSSTISKKACSRRTSTIRRSIPSIATSSRTTVSSRCRVASAIPIARAKSNRGSATRRRRRCTECASTPSRKAKPISITADARWADTRIHGTTKRQVAAMLAEEQPALQALPLEPFHFLS